ncbi:MAG: TolC family protein [Clostridiales bacterium]|jgi:hypothetical protein|nr:TolC family protein [Clostridiales bacterium]
MKKTINICLALTLIGALGVKPAFAEETDGEVKISVQEFENAYELTVENTATKTDFSQNSANEKIAASEPAYEKLTVKEAVDYIIANGDAIKKNAENQLLNEQSNKTVKEQLLEESDVTRYLDLVVSLMQNELQMTQNIENEAIIKEKTTYVIKQLFAAIIAAENDIKLFDEELNISQKELEISVVKEKYGAINAEALSSARKSYDKSVKSRVTKTNAVSNAYMALNREMGVSLNERRTPVLELEYAPLGDMSIAYAVSAAQNQSAELKNLTSNVDIAQYKLDTYVWEGDQSNNGEQSLEIALTQTKRSYNDKKIEIESTVMSAYNAIIQSETDYEAALTDLETARKQLEITKLQLEMGKTTALAVEKAEHQIRQQEESIRKKVIDHALQIEKLSDPNL